MNAVTIDRWAEKNIFVPFLPVYGQLDLAHNSPWLIEPLRAFADEKHRYISVSASAQSSKTFLLFISACYSVAEKPIGPVLWVASKQDEGGIMMRQRLIPILDACPPVRALYPSSRYEKALTDINFPITPLIVVGANSPADLQSKPCGVILLDEVRSYPDYALPLVEKRTTNFPFAKQLAVSCPGTVGDGFDRLWRSGDQQEYHVDIGCGHRNPLRWGMLHYAENETTRPNSADFEDNDGWDFVELDKTIRLVCPDCQFTVKDESPIRHAIAHSGTWVRHNPKASDDRTSFRWNALLPPRIPYSRLVHEWVLAQSAKRRGFSAPLRDFVQERLAEPWQEQEEFAEFEPVRVSPTGDKPEWEVSRFLAVDVQKDHLWFECRSAGKGGRSRLITYGKLPDFDALRAKQQELAVTDRRVLIDGRFRTQEVATYARTYGASIVMAEAFADYSVRLKNGKMVTRCWKRGRLDPNIGRSGQGKFSLQVFRFSVTALQEILDSLMNGKGVPWELPDNMPLDEYLAQIRAYKREWKRDSQGNRKQVWLFGEQDHLLACARQSLLGMILEGLYRAERIATAEDEPLEPEEAEVEAT